MMIKSTIKRGRKGWILDFTIVFFLAQKKYQFFVLTGFLLNWVKLSRTLPFQMLSDYIHSDLGDACASFLLALKDLVV
jgi:hypothetical protein